MRSVTLGRGAGSGVIRPWNAIGRSISMRTMLKVNVRALFSELTGAVPGYRRDCRQAVEGGGSGRDRHVQRWVEGADRRVTPSGGR